MASIADFKKDVQNTLNRNGSVFIREHNSGTPQFVNLGRVKESSVEADTVDSDADQDGRMSTQLLDLTISTTLQQGSNVELATIPDLARPDTSLATYSNGHTLYFAGTNQLSTSRVNESGALTNDLPDYTNLSSDDPDGIVFINVLLNPGVSLDLSGGQNIIPIEFSATVKPSVFENFGDTTQPDGNHILVSPE